MKTIMRLVFALAVALIVSPHLMAQKEELKELKQVSILVESLDEDALRLGVTTQLIQSQVLVAIKRDMPRVMIKDSGTPYVYVRISTIALNSDNSAVHLIVELDRSVNVLGDDGNKVGWTAASVWEKSMMMSGHNTGMAARILEHISEFITLLAAEYYKANP